ncbi:FAD/NAD(P)-binding domain-containing protein [Mucor ambiguus]|uniref:FAD/NAD(P)-binding domain-containing protein n=1 Tax=Mucor ambiguus TaxID=91626 RepID=A0A0C9MUJ4_9FUNG|nr:FAD/NAD(P)-binding domain-containing protein [Mucor ambiguus]
MKLNVSCISIFAASLPFVYCSNFQQHVLQDKDTPIVKSVAIIGGGAAGTSTAFWLSNVFPREGSVQVTSTIFERNSYLGGRSTVVPIKGDYSLGTIELGASIFVEANKNLMMAVEKFGLNKTRLTALEKEVSAKNRPGLGVWNGKEFLFEESGSYWDSMKALWRYGLTPLKFQRKQKEVVKRFMELYDADHGFEHVSEIVKNLDYQNLLNMTAEAYLKELGINDRFAQEILQTATRGNYCQDLNTLHALAVMVSMEAGHGTWAVESGNYNIFEEFARRSQAAIQLQTKVIAVNNITEVDTNGNTIQRYVVETLDGTSQVFDEVVIAAPIKFSGIHQFPFPTKHEERPYHAVYVTLIAGHPDPRYFGRTMENMPTFVVSTGNPLVDGFENEQAPFNTFSVHRFLENGESVIKIFSPAELKDDYLDKLFVERSWTYRKGWHAFPQLAPIAKNQPFPSFILKNNENDESGIIYTGAFENFISTMETQTIAGKNAARLLYDKWCNSKSGFNKNCREFGDGWGNYGLTK